MLIAIPPRFFSSHDEILIPSALSMLTAFLTGFADEEIGDEQ